MCQTATDDINVSVAENAANFKGEDLSVMVMKDSTHSRPTYVLNRGQYDAHGEQVYPTTPEAVMPFGDQLSRLQIASDSVQPLEHLKGIPNTQHNTGRDARRRTLEKG